MKHLSLVVPCYNEEQIIQETLEKLTATLNGSMEFELIVGNDGSSDRTAPIVREIMRRVPRIRLVEGKEHLGKGAILTRSLSCAEGDVVAFIDADLEIDVQFLCALLEKIESGFDLAIGSKVLHEDFSQRSMERRLATLIYNQLVRLFLGSKLHDHQAGLKAFRRSALLRILPLLKSEGWIWDTEMLVRAQTFGCRIAEIPVKTTYQRPSKVSLFKTAWDMAMGVASLFFQGVRVGNPLVIRDEIAIEP